MMIQVLFLFFLLLFIFFVCKRITSTIFLTIKSIINNSNIAIWILALFFLPGTIIHEMMHFLMATILRVSTGPLSIFPVIEKNDENHGHIKAKAGHIMVARTDPFRLTLIGLAPMIGGLAIIYYSGTLLLSDLENIFVRGITLSEILGIYLLFITSASMFSSRSDLKSLLISLPVTILIFSALYLSGVKIIFAEKLIEKITEILTALNRYLFLTAVVDYVIYAFLSVVNILFFTRK